MTAPSRWVIGVFVPLAVACVGGLLALTKDLWQPSPSAAKLLLANVTAKSITAFESDLRNPYGGPVPSEIPVAGLLLQELKASQLDEQMDQSDRISGAGCRMVSGERSTRVETYPFRLIFHADDETKMPSIARQLLPNDLGVSIYKVEQVYLQYLPTEGGGCGDVVKRHVGSGNLPGLATPFVVDLLVRNAGQTEAQVTGFTTRPIYLGMGECGGGGIDYAPFNREPLQINVDLKNSITGRFDNALGILPSKSILIRTSVSIDSQGAFCGPGFIYQLTLLYFDGHHEQQMIVGNFGFEGI
jgi:hypothetical protein